MLINSGDEGGCRKTIPFFMYKLSWFGSHPECCLAKRITMPNNIGKETTGMIY